MRKDWIGLDSDADLGQKVDWALATVTARENLLLIGPPGCAKTEIATQLFERLGLSPPRPESVPMTDAPESLAAFREWWRMREDRERQYPKYFWYLLSRFTQPEELFGPIEIRLLRQGYLTRVNFGLLTGAGVLGAFLDEVFKASSSILNSLLTLSQERRYFNWGSMQPADLAMLIGASNEMPGSFASGSITPGGGDEFSTLWAFLDRFAIRLHIPIASGVAPGLEDSNLACASKLAIRRDALRFLTGTGFEPRDASSARDWPVVNDLLLLGRACMQQMDPSLDDEWKIFAPGAIDDYEARVYRLAANLQKDGTRTEEQRITWTISPRKVKALFKVGLIHALVADDQFGMGGRKVQGPGDADLRVFTLIWDSLEQEGKLKDQVSASLRP
jgi:hypothetical protein